MCLPANLRQPGIEVVAVVTAKLEINMNEQGTGFRYPLIPARKIILVGGFGSGKTEVAVNLTRYLHETEKTLLTIADLDLVNPYFRSREVMELMEELGIRIITPRGGDYYADLPILLPEIRGAIESAEEKLVLDVGGDAQGARALGALSDAFVSGRYEMLMVLNSRRPFTSDVAGSIKTMTRIEMTSKLKFTGLISNSHMIDETSPEIIMEGFRLAREVEEATHLPLKFVSAKKEVLENMDPARIDCPVLPLTRLMLKPWERKK
ncbi:conserved hypothetical protein [Candidatus Zixiibacteriota bacterium]|nr:conserved hypothetical protein [candidate division Zixibacteria bacterium]